MKYITTILLICLFFNCFAPSKTGKTFRNEFIEFRQTKKDILNYIESHENFPFIDSIHYDINGNATIGFGHLIKSNEKFNKIDINEARKLLEDDFNESIRLVEFNYPFLKDNKLYAISHLCYCVGIGNVLRNDLFESDELNIDKLLSICYNYNKKNPTMYNCRIFEANLFVGVKLF